MTDGDRQADDAGEAYSLDLDDADATERDAAIREAVEAVERHGSSNREASVSETASAEEERQPAVANDGTVEPMEVERLREEVTELRERSLRTLADFENYRKRSEREREDSQRQAVAEPLYAFLEVVDNLERALGSEAAGEDLKIGVEMILRQVQDLNRRFGVEEMVALDEPFDPAFHEAVMRREDPAVTVATVVEEFQRGYRLRDRLLRPARVAVAVPPETGENPAATGGGEATGTPAAGDGTGEQAVARDAPGEGAGGSGTGNGDLGPAGHDEY